MTKYLLKNKVILCYKVMIHILYTVLFVFSYHLSKSLSHVWLFVTPWMVAHQAPPSMWFSRQEYWSGLPLHPPRDLPGPGIGPRSPALQADTLPSEPPGKPSYHLILNSYWKPLSPWKDDQMLVTCLLKLLLINLYKCYRRGIQTFFIKLVNCG